MFSSRRSDLPIPRLSAYSEMSMPAIRVIHSFAPGYGWSFTSPDCLGLIGGPANGADYESSKRHAESAVRFFFECEAKERNEPLPQDITFTHLTPRSLQARAS